MSSGEVEHDEPRAKTMSIAAIMTSLPPSVPMMENGGHELLADPNLVENYSDILKKKPDRMSTGGSETDFDSESASGSVVVTRSSTNTSPAKQRSSMLSNSSSHYSLRGGNDVIQPREGLEETVEEDEEDEDGAEEVEEKENTGELHHDDDTTIEEITGNKVESPIGEMTHDYEYSDSDFEEDMEKRLQDLNASGSDTDLRNTVKEENDSDHMILGLSLSEDEDSEEDDKLHLGLDDELVESSSDSDDYQPLSPPKELDPEKLYALYAFHGPDPSHCQLRQDESCTLLNDQDSYWWLVRRSYDSKIGFAPAEILETFPERLARLNCWKNENMSSQLSGHSAGGDEGLDGKGDQETGTSSSEGYDSNDKLEEKGSKSSILKNYVKDNKSVSFNDVVSYADRFLEEDVNADDTVDAVHYDEFTEADMKLNRLPEEDEFSEVVSDVSFNTASMAPLNVEKVRRPKIDSNQDKEVIPDPETSNPKLSAKQDNTDKPVKDEGDDLQKIFEAPTAPFHKGQNGGNRMQTSNSDYSISTIGDFSPSSSEWTNDSPQLQNEQFGAESDSSTIPSSRAIQDFSKYVEEDEKIESDTTSQCKSLETKIGSKKLDGNNSLQESKPNSIASTSSSSEQIFMDSEKVNSCTSINSAASVSKNPLHVKNTGMNKRHPLIDRLYNPIFDKMDELMRLLDEVANE